MLKLITEVLKAVQSVAADTYNPETYFQKTERGERGMLISNYILGTLFAKGYDNKARLNFEIYYTSNSGYQVWVWDFESEKCQISNDLNTPYYNTDKVIEYFSKVLA